MASLASAPDRFNFRPAVPEIKTAAGMAAWEESEAYQEYLGFILAIGQAVAGRKVTEQPELSAAGLRLLALLAELRASLASHPAEEMAARYGNPAFRGWFSQLEREAERRMRDILPDSAVLAAAAHELAPYLVDSFGNQTRIDYGTGHEMSFVMFLCALFKVGVLEEGDQAGVGLTVFAAYMQLSRELQTTYRMEPAGSMGVWNLDDYQFVSFIWGAAQLSPDTVRFKPKVISDPDMATALAKENHLFACLEHINTVKSGPFHEHSNQLWNISGVPRWSKVYTGLVKMYRAEVLSKFPVVQHTRFGSVFSLAPAAVRAGAGEPGLLLQTRLPGPGPDSPRPGHVLDRQ